MLSLVLALYQAPAVVLNAAPAGVRVAYGSAPSQYVQVFTPPGPGPFPVAAFIHGGCYLKSVGGVPETRDTIEDLVRRGVAVWAVEYRRTDEPGGGYPGMYQDVVTALDRMPVEAGRFHLDLTRAVLVGHSAGGHLVLWAAERANLPPSSPFRATASVQFRRAFALAAPGDLAPLKPRADAICGPGVFDRVVGPITHSRPDQLADTSPAALLPLKAPTTLIAGSADSVVPPALVTHFEEKARASGSDVTYEVRLGAGHLDLVVPNNAAWQRTAEEISQAVAR